MSDRLQALMNVTSLSERLATSEPSEEEKSARSDIDLDEEMGEQEEKPASPKTPKLEEQHEDPIKLEEREPHLEDDEPEGPQESIHATGEPDDEAPDCGGEEGSDGKPTSFSDHAQEEEEPEELLAIFLHLLQVHSFQRFLEFYKRCRFINDTRPKFQYLPQSQRDYQNENHGVHGLQFFKVRDHFGDHMNRTMLRLRDSPLTGALLFLLRAL